MLFETTTPVNIITIEAAQEEPTDHHQLHRVEEKLPPAHLHLANPQNNLEEEGKGAAVTALLTPTPSTSSLQSLASTSTAPLGEGTILNRNRTNSTSSNLAANISRVFSIMNKKSQITLNLADDPATKPLYAITPTDSVVSMEESSVATPSESVAIGIHESDSTTRLQPGQGNMRNNQDSSESLISHTKKETWWTILLQVSLPYFVAGLGMVGAGILLDHVMHWTVFVKVPEFLVLATPLLGLKGNLEMTLASRLSTHANLGTMNSRKTMWLICYGNLALVQVQAVVVGFLASLVAIITGILDADGEPFNFHNAVLLCSSSMVTASIASFILGVLMIVVILVSKMCNMNPDNIATPIAASLGDITTLGLLAFTGSILHALSNPWIGPVIISLFCVMLPFWIYITYNNEYTRQVLLTGWTPVIIAMLISSGGGVILDYAKGDYPQLALYQPVINGVGGNLVSVQASRISTALHRDSTPGTLPGKQPGTTGTVWRSPVSVFMSSGVDSVAARVLLGIVVPGHIVFSFLTHMITTDSNYTTPFMIFYLSAAFIQVAILLFLAQILVAFFWKRKIDPDTNAIPYLTALGDLLGTGLLYGAFTIVHFLRC